MRELTVDKVTAANIVPGDVIVHPGGPFTSPRAALVVSIEELHDDAIRFDLLDCTVWESAKRRLSPDEAEFVPDGFMCAAYVNYRPSHVVGRLRDE